MNDERRNFIRERAVKATSIVIDADMNFYRPSHGYGNIPIIEGKLYDVPMNKPDVEYYRSVNPTTVISLLDTIERYEKSLEYVSKMAELDEQTRHMKAAETYYWATIDMMGKAAREALNPKEGE